MDYQNGSERPTPSDGSAAALVEKSLVAVSRLTVELEAQRRKTRRARWLLMVPVGAIAGSFALSALMSSNTPAPMPAEKTAAVVRISGPILPDSEASAAKVMPVLQTAFESKTNSSVILVINSPGGTPVQANLIRAKIDELQAKHNKKVVVIGEDMLASGAYLIAVAADHIIADPSSVVGSIGVVTRGFGLTGLMDKLGVERRVQTAGTSKNTGDPFSPRTAAEMQSQQKMLDGIHKVFIEQVKAGRGAALKSDNPDLFTGAVFTGDEARDAGLVDELGHLKEAKAYLGVERLEVYRTTPFALLDKLGLLGLSTHIGKAASSLIEAESATAAIPLATASIH